MYSTMDKHWSGTKRGSQHKPWVSSALGVILGYGYALTGAAGESVSAPGSDQSAENVAAAPAIWPCWRGPQRDGRVDTGPAWPESLKEDRLRKSWRLELGPSYSGPIIAPDRVFVTETVDELYEATRALDRKTGKEIWRSQWEGSMEVPFFAKKNGSWIRATPAWDGDSLYVAGMEDYLVCLDAATGERRWTIDFREKFGTPTPDFGFVSSPLIDGEDLYVQAGGSFVKLNKRTGDVIWRTLVDGGGMYGSAFSSPMLGEVRGARQVLVQTRNELAGVDIKSGEALWKQFIESFRGMNILTPTVYQGAVFTSNYRGKSYMFRPESDQKSAETMWTSKAQGYMSSPIVHNDHAYMHLQNTRVVCIDLRDGTEKWRTSDRFGDYWSMVAQGDRILALDEGGELILIRANPEKFELIDRREISDQSTWAHLAVAGRDVMIRELNAIQAWIWE